MPAKLNLTEEEWKERKRQQMAVIRARHRKYHRTYSKYYYYKKKLSDPKYNQKNYCRVKELKEQKKAVEQ